MKQRKEKYSFKKNAIELILPIKYDKKRKEKCKIILKLT